jgi:hypothetical protein
LQHPAQQKTYFPNLRYLAVQHPLGEQEER